ncbi:collagen alpha-1(XIII) chain-like [Menidia menidia]
MEGGQMKSSFNGAGEGRRNFVENQQNQQNYPEKPHRGILRDLPGFGACLAACALCLGACLFVLVRSSELKSRIVSLEQQQDACMSAAQVEPFILARLDTILEEKLAAHLPKHREAREAPHGCLCPPDEGPKTEAVSSCCLHLMTTVSYGREMYFL